MNTMNERLGPPADSMCRLCWREVPLVTSHIIPAFVYRELKRTSATGHMRFSSNPNVRVQDGLKLPWLCNDCEQRFSAWERKFANEVVIPWSDGRNFTRYGDWLLKFCVSVSWRVLVYAKGLSGLSKYTPEQEKLCKLAESTWREFLLGDRSHPGQFEQHLIIWDFTNETSVSDLPTNFNRFIMNSIMLDIVGGTNSTYSWSKLGRFQIFGTIAHGSNKWENTKVRVREGVLKPGQVVLPAPLLDLYKEKAKITEKAQDSISDAQFAKIDAALMANIDQFIDSRTFQAIQADAEMFGKNAVIRKSRDIT